MTDEEQREAALDFVFEQRIKASEYRQMGCKELARWMQKNADAAFKWATRKPDKAKKDTK